MATSVARREESKDRMVLMVFRATALSEDNCTVDVYRCRSMDAFTTLHSSLRLSMACPKVFESHSAANCKARPVERLTHGSLAIRVAVVCIELLSNARRYDWAEAR